METNKLSIAFISFCLIQSVYCASIIKRNDVGLKNVENLDDFGKVVLSWEVDSAKEIITFEIEAETNGYIGFGISPQGSMTGADIFIGGVNEDGTPYYSDRFGTGFEEPKVDDHEDWTLLNATETDTTTYLKFSRPLNSCDEEDYPITDDTNRIIWAMGATDAIVYHAVSGRGSRSLNLLGAPIPEIDLENMQTWDMTLDMTMPEVDTAYWCSFHKGPVLDKKHHVVAFEALLPSELALLHTHHFIIYNCYLPADSNQTMDEVFGDYTVDKGMLGDFCYKPNETYPTDYCEEYMYVWAKGGKRFVLPETLGYSIGEEDARHQRYYMMEIHYDNPEKVSNATFNTGVRVYYTNNTRETDAGQLTIGHLVSPSMLVPPNTSQFIVVGHCSPDCTAQFPTEGITVFNSMLHSHLSGRKLKIRHFRDGKELEWLDYDDHYDFNYQQNKPLTREVKIFPGDHLIYECTYDSTWKNGSVVAGGLSTVEEMCQAFLWYYPKIDIEICASMYDVTRSFFDLDITNFTQVIGIGLEKYHIIEPEYLEGDFEESMSLKYNWTEEARERHQYLRRFSVHQGFCINRKNPESFQWADFISYPHDFVPYLPDDTCLPDGNGNSSGFMNTSTLGFNFFLILICKTISRLY